MAKVEASPEVALLDIRKFEARNMGPRLRALRERNLGQLRTRHFGDSVERYDTPAEARRAVIQDRISTRQGKRGIFIPFDIKGSGDPIGLAAITPDRELRRLPKVLGRVVSPAISRKLGRQYPFAGPNVRAWLDEDKQHLLTPTYKALIELALQDEWNGEARFVWTVEPHQSDDTAITDAIVAAGLGVVEGPARFDGQEYDKHEGRGSVPPKSILLARVPDATTSFERQAALTYGQQTPPTPPIPLGMLG